MKISGFDWDRGNWPKCGKHGVSREEIESLFLNEPMVMADPNPVEPRRRAIGKAASGRFGPLRLSRVRAAHDSGQDAHPPDQRPLHACEGDCAL